MKNFFHPMLGLRHAGAANVASEVPQPGEEPLRQVRGDPAAGRRVRRQRLHPEDAQVEDGLDLVLVGGLARVVIRLAEPVDVHPEVQMFCTFEYRIDTPRRFHSCTQVFWEKMLSSPRSWVRAPPGVQHLNCQYFSKGCSSRIAAV